MVWAGLLCVASAQSSTPCVETGPKPPIAVADAERARASIQRMGKLLESSPDPGNVMYVLAVRYASLGEDCEALRWLWKVVDLQQGFDPSTDEAFKSLRTQPEFKRLAADVNRSNPSVNRSRVAFSIPENDLMPEGMAYDPVGKEFYVGSIYKRKIIRITADGRHIDFKKASEDGLWSVLGMKVDARNNSLWVCSAAEYEDTTANGSSGVFHFDLRSGRLIKKYVLDGKNAGHLFNDLVINSQGDVFLTDSLAGTVDWISHQTDALTEFSPGLELIYPNGIALSSDEKQLYVAHFNGGVTVINLQSKQFRILAHSPGVTLAGIDGLYFYKDSLIAIQSGIGTPRITRFFMNFNGDRVERIEILERGNRLFDTPTTGAIAGDVFFYIGTSQLKTLNAQGKITSPELLRPILIMKTRL